MDLFHLRVRGEELHHPFGVFGVTLQTQREGLHALQQEERGERRDARARVAQQHRADIGHERGGAHRFDERHPVITRVGLRHGGILAGGRPVEFAGVHDHAAQRGAVAAEEFSGRMDHDIGAVLDGANEIGGAEGVVHHQGQTVFVRERGQRVEIGDIAVGVAERFHVDGAGVRPDGGLDLGEVVDIDEGGGDAEVGQSVPQQVETAAVDGLLRHDVAAVLPEGFQRVGDGGGAGSQRQRGHAAFQRGDPLFKDVLRGVGEAPVDIARVGKPETGGRVRGVVKNVRGGGVDRHGPRVGGGVGALLPHVQLERFEFIRHDRYFLSVIK